MILWRYLELLCYSRLVHVITVIGSEGVPTDPLQSNAIHCNWLEAKCEELRGGTDGLCYIYSHL